MRGRPLGGDCLESRTLGNKHSSLIIKKDASWGSLLRLRRGKEVGGKGLVGGGCAALIVVPAERNVLERRDRFGFRLRPL